MSYKKKEKLKEIICDIKRKDKEFATYTDFNHISTCLGIHLKVCKFKIGDIKEIIKISKEEWIKQHIKNFLENYFTIKICIDPQQRRVSVSENKYCGCVIFTVGFNPYWISEDINLHVENIKEYIEESKKKFEELREIKYDKSDKSHHLELLLIEGKLVAYETFSSLIDELDKKLNKEIAQKDYEYLLFPVCKSVGKYYLLIHMDKKIGVANGGLSKDSNS